MVVIIMGDYSSSFNTSFLKEYDVIIIIFINAFWYENQFIIKKFLPMDYIYLNHSKDTEHLTCIFVEL